MQIDSPRSNTSWLLWLVAVALIAGLAVFASVLFKPSQATPFEVGNFFGQAEVYTSEEKNWVPLTRGSFVYLKDKIRTADNSEVTLLIRDKVQIRVKENSELELSGSKASEVGESHELHLSQGVILGATGKQFAKTDLLEVSTPVSVAAIRGTLFRVAHDPTPTKTNVSVLQGKVEVTPLKSENSVFVKSLQTVDVVPYKFVQETPARVSREQWVNMKEAYDLIQKSLAEEQRQMDLAPEAGTMFDSVFDHGTFYMPKFGFAQREFVQDELTEEVFFNVKYDVFPRGSYAGVYMKTRSFDISKYEGFEFQIRRMPGEDYPEQFRIEFKSRGAVVRAFAPKVFKKDWRPMEFKFSANREEPITEITFVFTHEKVGEHKKGAIQLRHLNLIEKTDEETTASQAPRVVNETIGKVETMSEVV